MTFTDEQLHSNNVEARGSGSVQGRQNPSVRSRFRSQNRRGKMMHNSPIDLTGLGLGILKLNDQQRSISSFGPVFYQ